ncbi:hypothetical protein AAHN97_08040 [Chitinophaga niabensis]|uniref:hypothetical protein n=1 Tax=Chitinophaga niabensis TaxID=536979 RepID=UPI0031BAC199
MTTFRIEDTFKITNRGLVIVGELLSGNVKPNDILKFQHDTSEITVKIKNIGSVDNIMEKIFKTGLFLAYENGKQRLLIENMKIVPQIAVIENL